MKAKISLKDICEGDYPKLLHWHNDENFVVLFTAKGVGTVLRSNPGDWEVGHWSDGWSFCDGDWRTFCGKVSVKLSN